VENFRNHSGLDLSSKSDLILDEKCVHDIFAHQAKLNPENIAVTINEKCITYFELNKKADYLAYLLRSENLNLTPIVGIAIDRSIDLIVAVLAVLKAGGVCVPLDTSYPEKRLCFMAKDAGVNILLTTKKIVELYPYLNSLEKDNILFYLDAINFHTNTPNLSIQENFSSLDHLIYILYTSGSTGIPKGVAMPHRALSNLIRWHLINFDNEKPSNTLQFSPISFDVSFQEIFSTLCSGQTLVLVSEETRKDPYALFELIKSENISQLFLPAVALQQFAKVAKMHEPLKALKTVFTAGEQLKITPDIELLFENTPEAYLYNHYGPTETHVVTSHRLAKENIPWPKLPPIGVPILNVETYILDKNRNLVQAGSMGELYIGGDCLAKGYHHLPELTKERFVSNPFGVGLLYKTGDLVCSHADGVISFLGRIDRQVKIRGFRIELGEIEVALIRNKNIEECVVVDGDTGNGHKELIAYIVLTSEFENKLNIFKRGDFGYKIAPKAVFVEFINHLNKILPSYMFPSSFIIIDKLPLTPSGKVDYGSLPLPPLLNINSLIDFVKMSQNTLEEKITIIWEEILQIRPIANNENFFDLGGNSLLLETVNVVLSKVFDYEFSIIVFFNHPTIQSLVTSINGNQNVMSYRETKITRSSVLNSKPISLRRNLRKRSQARNSEDE